MFAAPAEGILKDFMEFAETGCGDHEQAPPHQRTHATEHYAKLINRNRRYGRFRHASSLPKPTRTPSNLTPGISRSQVEGYADDAFSLAFISSARRLDSRPSDALVGVSRGRLFSRRSELGYAEPAVDAFRGFPASISFRDKYERRRFFMTFVM